MAVNFRLEKLVFGDPDDVFEHLGSETVIEKKEPESEDDSDLENLQIQELERKPAWSDDDDDYSWVLIIIIRNVRIQIFVSKYKNKIRNFFKDTANFEGTKTKTSWRKARKNLQRVVAEKV